ncbi:hypothetical protein XI09_40945 [Bradyrhizobium sp. CCBAU 11386]|nr:hypothetical protein [Bradyrhizobium sp. CCBAU 11386]
MKGKTMADIDHDWDTGEFQPIKPVAPSRRGKPQPAKTSTPIDRNGAAAVDQGQGDEQAR